jgi:hypothetical protein
VSDNFSNTKTKAVVLKRKTIKVAEFGVLTKKKSTYLLAKKGRFR